MADVIVSTQNVIFMVGEGDPPERKVLAEDPSQCGIGIT